MQILKPDSLSVLEFLSMAAHMLSLSDKSHFRLTLDNTKSEDYMVQESQFDTARNMESVFSRGPVLQ